MVGPGEILPRPNLPRTDRGTNPPQIPPEGIHRDPGTRSLPRSHRATLTSSWRGAVAPTPPQLSAQIFPKGDPEHPPNTPKSQIPNPQIPPNPSTPQSQIPKSPPNPPQSPKFPTYPPNLLMHAVTVSIVCEIRKVSPRIPHKGFPRRYTPRDPHDIPQGSPRVQNPRRPGDPLGYLLVAPPRDPQPLPPRPGVQSLWSVVKNRSGKDSTYRNGCG